ncbi:MAG TPA: PA14 domain-containing protein, partial [Puia sp.]
MKAIFTRFFSMAFLLLLAGFFSTSAIAQTGVLNPNDPIVIYNPASKPVTPPNGTLVKWVKTTRLSWNSTSLKCYYISGIPFRLKFPKSYSTAADGKTYPLYLFFHGIGEKGTIYDNEYSMAHGGDVHTAAVDNGTFDGFLLYPQSTSASGGWNAAQLSVIYGLIMNHLIPEVKVDPNRVIVNGLSGGGAATWEFVEAYPQLVAADIPMSGASSTDVTKVSSLIYNPIWLLTGGLDVSPSPYTAGQVASAAAAAGCDFSWKLYTTLAHNTWDSTWKEPDYFPFMLRAHKANPWARFGRTDFCPGDPINVTLGVTPGFTSYQWRKNGVVIPGAGSNTINVTDLGTYDCRIERGSTWSVWSPIPVVIKTKLPTVTPDIKVLGLASDVIPAPDGSTSVNLQVPTGYVNYVWQKLNPTTTLSNTTNILSGATAGGYQVKVTEQYGCSSSFSNTFNVIDANGPNPPSIPTNLQAVAASQTLIKLSWNEDASPANPETQFEIYQSSSSADGYKLIGFSPAHVDSFAISGLNAKTRYYFKIRAINNTAGSPATLPASALTASDNTAPTAPNNLRTGDISANSVELFWDSAFDDVRVTNYDIYVNGKLSYTTGNQNNYTVYNLTTGQIYTFVVKARDLSGNVSLPSNQVVSAAAFNGLTYKYYTFTGTWNNLPDFRTLTPDATGSVPNVDISERDQDDNFAFLWEGFIQIPRSGNYTFRTNSDDGSKLYLGALNQTTSPYSFGATALVNNDGLHGGQNVNSSVVNLTAGVYPIAVTYYEQGGGQSIAVSWKTPQSGSSFVTIPDSVFAQKVTFPGSAPSVPSKLTATAASAKKINLSWQDNSNNENGFEIYRATSPTGDFAIVGTTGPNQTSFGDSTCSPATTYYYKIKSIGQYGSSAFNNQDSSSLSYNFYANFTASTLATLTTLTPTDNGLSNNFSLGVTTATTNFGLIFDGYINIRTAGTYTFYTSSDDGSSLYIDGTATSNRVVNNDGAHGTTEKSGTKSLTVGRHKIRVMFFQQGGGEVLTVSYSGP